MQVTFEQQTYEQTNQRRVDDMVVKQQQLRQRHDDLIDSLYFEQVDQRFDELVMKNTDDCHWLLRRSTITCETISIVAMGFASWLENAGTIYWICGKLGSGKSTLMANLVRSQNIINALNRWSQQRRLCVVRFFFWRAGSSLQNTKLGLLRSLLYQICEFDVDLVDRSVQRYTTRKGRQTHWTASLLERVILDVITSASETCFCVFIDGLDECCESVNLGQDVQGELYDLCRQWSSLGNLKICASSRPEATIRTRFRLHPHLHLEEHNYAAIEGYVQDRLSKFVTQSLRLKDKDFHKTIAKRSEGIFLWAVLAVNELMRGDASGDDDVMLSRRLEEIPPAMDDIFKLVTKNIQTVHKETLAFYLKIAELSIDREFLARLACVPVITAARTRQQAQQSSLSLQECQRTVNQICALSAGLLEIRETRDAILQPAKWAIGSDWTTRESMEAPENDAKMTDKARVRRSISQNMPLFPEILHFEKKRINWVHRSAHDFMKEPENAQSLGLPAMDDEEVLRQLFEASLHYYEFAPSYLMSVGRSSTTLTSRRRDTMINAAAQCWQVSPTSARYLTVRLIDASEAALRTEQTWSTQAASSLACRDRMWLEFARHQFWDHINSHKNDVAAQICGHLLCAASKNNDRRPHRYDINAWLARRLYHLRFSAEHRQFPDRQPRVLCRSDDQLFATLSYTPIGSCANIASQDSDTAIVSLAIRRYWDGREKLSELRRIQARGHRNSTKIRVSGQSGISHQNLSSKNLYRSLKLMASAVDLHVELANYKRRLCLQVPATALQILACQGHKGRFNDLSGDADQAKDITLRLVCVPKLEELRIMDSASDEPTYGHMGSAIVVQLSSHTSYNLLQHLIFAPDDLDEYPEPHSLQPVLCATDQQIDNWQTSVLEELGTTKQSLVPSELETIMGIILTSMRAMLVSIQDDTPHCTVTMD